MAQYNRSYQANFDCKRPLNTPSAPTMRITDWIRSLRLRRCWKSSGRNEYSSSLPTPSSIRTATVAFPVTTKPGQRPFPCRRTAALRATVLIWLWMSQSWSDRSVYTAGTKNASGTGERLCLAKAQTGAYHPQACFIEETGAGTMSAKSVNGMCRSCFGFPMRRWKRSSRKWHSSEQKT